MSKYTYIMMNPLVKHYKFVKSRPL